MGGFGSVAPFEAPAYNGDLLDDADWETVEGLSAAKEAVMWLRRKASAATTFQRRLEQKNPYLFIEYWKEGARPFEWLAEWEHLSLDISDIRISVSQHSVDEKFGRDQQSIPLRKFDERSISQDVPDDQKKAYLAFVSNLFNDAFTKPDSERTAVISGKFTTEENRDIGFIRSGESKEGKRTIRERDISIRASTNIRIGSLWSASEHDWVSKTRRSVYPTACCSSTDRSGDLRDKTGHSSEPANKSYGGLLPLGFSKRGRS